MGLSPAVVLPARANAQAAERNAAIVEHWVKQSSAGDLSGADTLLAAHVTLHAVPGTTTRTRRAFLDFLSNGVAEGGRLQVSQIEVFGEGDKVCVLYSADGHDGPVSAVRFYRVVDERIAEAWWGPSAEVRWSWDNELDGDLDVQANRQVLARWYEDVYAEGDWQLVPDLVGPAFLRHEDREFSMGPEEYRDRLSRMFGSSLRLSYEVVAGHDKVAVIGRVPDGRGFLQAWRVRDGRLVESWWAPGLAEW